MKKIFLYFPVILLFVVIGCQKRDVNDNPDIPGEIETMEDLVISDHFDFGTSTDISFSVSVSKYGVGQPFIPVTIHSHRPENGGKLLLKGATNQQGVFESVYPLPDYMDSVYVTTNIIGIPNEKSVPVIGSLVSLGFSEAQKTKSSSAYKSINAVNYDFPVTFLSEYNSIGVPDNLTEDHVVGEQFMEDLNKSLPEKVSLTESHPEFLDPENELDLILEETADVWVTFVHEGAGFRNTVGFYTYDVNNPPSNPSEIEMVTFIFPNFSYASGGGGGLVTGNTVKIGQFEANTAIGWVLISNGWSDGTVQDRRAFFSNTDFNPESETDKKQHTVLLNDPKTNRYIIGFEDLYRGSWSDDDFNDAVFYVSTNPMDAPNTDNVPNMDSEDPDSDGDGIPDNQDEYPNDPDKAFDNNYEGSLAYEDLWPGKGDYDFNDIVIDYEISQITNSANKVSAISATYTLRAYGAEYHNGFGFEMNAEPSKIASVSGTEISDNYITLSGNGTEANQESAVVIVFDDAYDVLPYPGSGIGVNTDPDFEYLEPVDINVDIVFSEPVSVSSIGTPPYNPFIIADQQRGYEIHLPDKEPTSLVDETLLGQWEDDSDPLNGRYFKTEGNLPWGINVAGSFDYPIEKIQIIDAHLKFAEWAQSSGELFPDWYLDEPGYRNQNNIYPEQE